MQIANPDRTAMNRLYAKELKRAGVRTAAADDNGSVTPQCAFDDHEKYLKTLESIMKSDKTAEFEPNDPLKD